jgi:hypothetical protein
MRLKVEAFEIQNPKEAMEVFRDALAKIVKVPRQEVERKRAIVKKRHKRKRKL